MGLSLEQLWKDAPDDAIIDAAAKWNTLNEEGRKIVLAEAKRRGLKVEAPKGNGATASGSTAGTSPTHASASQPTATMNAKIWMIVAVAAAVVATLAVLV